MKTLDEVLKDTSLLTDYDLKVIVKEVMMRTGTLPIYCFKYENAVELLRRLYDKGRERGIYEGLT